MIADSIKEKIRMGWGPLGHFYIDKDIVPALDSFRHKIPSGRLAVITNDIISGPSQVSIIGLPSLFTPNDAEFIQVLGTVAFYMFEFKLKLDRDNFSFRFDGTSKEYTDGVLNCRWVTDGGSFGGPFECFDLMLRWTIDKQGRHAKI